MAEMRGQNMLRLSRAAQLFQQPDASQTVSLFVQPGGIDADAHTGRGDRHDAAPHAAFGWQSHFDGEVPRAVVHAAGHQHGVDIVGISGGEQPLAGGGAAAPAGEGAGDMGQVPAVHPDGAGRK